MENVLYYILPSSAMKLNQKQKFEFQGPNVLQAPKKINTENEINRMMPFRISSKEKDRKI